jgi:hypothetical protein
MRGTTEPPRFPSPTIVDAHGKGLPTLKPRLCEQSDRFVVGRQAASVGIGNSDGRIASPLGCPHPNFNAEKSSEITIQRIFLGHRGFRQIMIQRL